MKHLTYAAALCVMGTASWAACPAAGALEQGISLTTSDGAVETFKTIGPGRVENITDVGESEGSYQILAQGIYLRSTTQMNDGQLDGSSMTTYNFPLEDAQMPVPVAGGIWNVEVAVFDGGEIFNEFHNIQFGQQTRYTVGACGYDMIPVVIRIGGEDDWFEETLYYLPELEIAIYGKFDAVDEPEEVYTYKSIALVAE